MIDKIKKQTEAFAALPDPVKISLYGVGLFLVVFLIYFAGSNYYSSYKVEQLQKENRQLNDKAENALDRMGKAQAAAANEKLRADNLESTMKLLDAQIQKQDETLSISRKNTSSTRRDLDTIRRSEPQRADADALTERLKARYGKTGNTGPSRQGP
jgi:uncharacterized protein HemX